jgi:hypothetical protein
LIQRTAQVFKMIEFLTARTTMETGGFLAAPLAVTGGRNEASADALL